MGYFFYKNMNKISVIIPTIYKKPKVLYKLIETLSSDICVEEILLISNAEQIITLPNTLKLRIYKPEANLYVNASWNIGINLIKQNNFLIINDDILICEDFCKTIVNSDIFNREDTGLIGLNPMSIKQFPSDVDDLEIPVKSNPIILKYCKFLDMGDWGSAFLGKKQNYYAIPQDLKIIFGDNYLAYKNLLNNKFIYSISNMKFNHIHSASSASSEFKEICKSDCINAKKYFCL